MASEAPSNVINRLEQIRRRFLWGGLANEKKVNWVAWNTVQASKDRGGLGIGSLKSHNHALLLKWWWKFRDGNRYIWKDVIFSIHGLENKPLHQMFKVNSSGTWKSIGNISKDLNELGLNLTEIFSYVAGNGKRIRFWKDVWIGDLPLQDKFPSLYTIEMAKDCCIADRIQADGFSWQWSNGFNNQPIVHEFCDLLHFISSYVPKLSEDKWVCKLSTDGSYNVCKVRSFIDLFITSPGYANMPWLNWVPLKVNCFVWRACMGKIAVAKGLINRGIIIGSDLCKICGLEAECSDHALILCPRALESLKRIFRWCGINFPYVSSVAALIEFGSKWGRCLKKRKIFIAILQCSLWCIWLARNDMVFNNYRKSSLAIVNDITSTSQLWIKNRSKISCNWVTWNYHPFS